MVHSTFNACIHKKKSKRSHRRLTVDASCLRQARPLMERRPSLSAPRSVHFSERSEFCVFDTPPSKNWYTAADHGRFKRERLLEIMSFRKHWRKPGTNQFSGSCCPVGVEQLLSAKGMREDRSNRKIAIKSILLEQSRQRNLGFRDPDHIALLSIKLSSAAFRGAQKRGKFQEMAKLVE